MTFCISKYFLAGRTEGVYTQNQLGIADWLFKPVEASMRLLFLTQCCYKVTSVQQQMLTL